MARKLGIYHVSRAFAEISKSKPEEISPGPATFEEAISATGFGKFNWMVMLLGVLPVNWAVLITISNIGQIIPFIKCDFKLSISEIGVLNASPFIGNILSPFLWGYLADTMGRRKLMIYTALADAMCTIICSFSVNMAMLAIFKFIGGFIIMAPAGIVLSYLSECHNTKYRSKLILLSGIFYGSSNLILSLLAWAILPGNFIYFRSWQLYLLVCAIPSLVAGLSFIFFPESPKFLMTIGRHDEALNIFKKIYAMNTGNPVDSYPISKLMCENKEVERDAPEKNKNNWEQFKPLFFQPYLWRVILVTSVQFFMMLGANTLRVWLPEIFTLMDQYNSTSNMDNPSVCQLLVNSVNKTYDENIANATMVQSSCNAHIASDNVYIKLSIIGVCSILMFILVIIAVSVINKKIVLGFLKLVSGISGIMLIWCTNPIIIVLISAFSTTLTGVALVTFMSIVVDLFPTSFRTLTILMATTAGRIGSIFGNLIFPMLFATGCAPPFILLGGSVLVCIIPLVLLSSAKEED